jgi:hypothetical protein
MTLVIFISFLRGAQHFLIRQNKYEETQKTPMGLDALGVIHFVKPQVDSIVCGIIGVVFQKEA